MVTDKKFLSRELSNALEQIATKANEMGEADIISAYDEIESSFISKVSNQVDLIDETRRRVAEWKFDLLSKRDVSWSELEQIHAKIRDLGYTDIEREATREIIFARACIRHGNSKLAEINLDSIHYKLENSLKNNFPNLHEELKNTVESLINSLKK